MSWLQLIAAIKSAWQRAKWAAHDAVGALVCKAKGQCHFDTDVFHGNCLYFCTRCGKEICGRTFDDLLPMTDEQMEQMEWIHRLEEAA